MSPGRFSIEALVASYGQSPDYVSRALIFWEPRLLRSQNFAGGSLATQVALPLPDQIPVILLRGHTATHGVELLIGEGHFPAATLARYLDCDFAPASLRFTQSGPGCCVLGNPYLLR
jgi:hypothetical protein